MTADRHKISSNALNDIIASIIRESQGCVDFVLSQMSTLRGRKKLRSLKFESVKENFLAHYFTIHWDEKLLKFGKAYTHKEHVAVLASSTNGKLVKLLGITDLDSGIGLNQAKAVKICWKNGALSSDVLQCVSTQLHPTPRSLLEHVFYWKLL